MSNAINLGQAIATAASVAGVGGVAAGAYFPWSKRREERREAATVAREARIAAVLEERTRLVVSATIAETKRDMIARVDLSDTSTREQLVELKVEVKEIRDKASAIEIKQAREFGGNGGGARQAIDSLSQSVAGLAGRFDQHIAETKETRQ